MDRRDFAIGILSTTGVILLVGLVLLQTRPPAAVADGMTVAGGGYLMTVGAIARTDEEAVYVIDTSTSRMVAYRFDSNRRTIQMTQGIDLGEIGETLDRREAARKARTSQNPAQSP